MAWVIFWMNGFLKKRIDSIHGGSRAVETAAAKSTSSACADPERNLCRNKNDAKRGEKKNTKDRTTSMPPKITAGDQVTPNDTKVHCEVMGINHRYIIAQMF